MIENSKDALPDLPFSRICKTGEIPAKGLSSLLKASKKECSDIAGILDLLELGTLSFDYKLMRMSRDRFKLTGRLLAQLTQSCVVTLDPVESTIDERLEIEFWPLEDVERIETVADEEGMAIPPEGPEPILDDQIDIGHLAFEHLAAALDPYPRKPGTTFEWRDPQGEKESETGYKPFAELDRLIRPKNTSPD